MIKQEPNNLGRLSPRQKRWMVRVLDIVGSIPLGITLLALIFIFCSLGSAFPQVRQHEWFELTEYAWFQQPLFQVLMALFSLALTLVTVRKIPLRWVNLGVWMIHTGILTMIAGSYLYFSRKFEGEAPVFRRHVRIEIPGAAEPEILLALPDNEVTTTAAGLTWKFSIAGTHSAWPILSEPDKGKTAYAVNVVVTPPSGEPFIRQLLDGYPEYTEDRVPGQGRAIKQIGRKLMDESLRLTLELEPQNSFQLLKTWALFLRRPGDKDWIERPIEGLPMYNDRLGSRDQAFADPGASIPIRPLDLRVSPRNPADPLASVPIHVTGYLRYAQMQSRWRDGGVRFNPVLRLSAIPESGSPVTYELAAFDPKLRAAENGAIEFLWLSDRAELQNLPTDSRAALSIRVPASNVEFSSPMTAETIVGREGAWTPIPQTEFSYRVLNVVDDLAMPDGRNLSVAMVEVQSPEGRFTRMAADRLDASRDLHNDDDPHNPEVKRGPAMDQRIQIRYSPRSAPILVAAHPEGLHLIVNGPEGRAIDREFPILKPIEIVPGLILRAESLMRNALLEQKPYIVPPEKRDRNMGENAAMIRIDIGDHGASQSGWLRFNAYALPSAQYAYAGRFAYTPSTFRLPDGTDIELLFSRQRAELPVPIALDHFALDVHDGGYTGSALTIRNYVSRLRFLENGRWSDSAEISVNHPTGRRGYWFFQSQWDSPRSGDPSGGMNYTGLGVGNREGVYVQLSGCCLSVLGMVYAFYWKPILKRKRREEAARASERSADGVFAEFETTASSQREGAAI